MAKPIDESETADYLEDYVCLNDDSTSHSSSSVSCTAVKGSHVLKVHGYSILKQLRGKRIESKAFEVGGHRWRLDLYLNGDSDDEHDDEDDSGCDSGDEDEEEDVGIYLHLLDDREPDSEPVFARPRFNVLCQNGVPEPATCIGWRRFPDGNTVSWGEDLISREELEKSENIKDDSFAVQCDVEAPCAVGKDDGETTDSFGDYVCVEDDSTSHSSTVNCKVVKGSHDLRVHDYTMLRQLRRKRVASPAFDVAGHSWRLQLYLNGDSDDGDDNDERDAEYVHIYLRLLHSGPDREPVFARPTFSLLTQNEKPGHVRYLRWQSFPYGKITACGGNNLITRKKLEKKFLNEDSFTVRCDVEVAVVTQGHDDNKA
ncbi:hypothetical protein QOZ80_6BG0470150 [Eleusine coracana subsp. coracana]|nr:hypothetical protein QOZ80_6BG0470150 [Eleusine coracana subsp. coracana]